MNDMRGAFLHACVELFKYSYKDLEELAEIYAKKYNVNKNTLLILLQTEKKNKSL